ncbi:tetratricopeptide repeat protein [Candidatus Sumerlaeota bacterium]|nr:tetratricopeptide repeat protein [Candidatus Sumerlaeota bacterium]
MKPGEIGPTRKSREKSLPDRKDLLWGAILLVMVFAAYFPALRAGFVWDDDALTQNLLMLNFAGLKKIWFEPSLIPREAHYWPLVYTSFWFEYHIWRLFPPGFHFTNILLHGINALLLWMILKRLGIGFAWFAAAVFALHPTRVESAAWVIERKDVLSGFFYFLSFLHYTKFDENKKTLPYILSLFFFLCGMLSKSIVASLPVAFVLFHLWKDKKIDGKRLVHLAPFFMLAVLLTLFDLWIFRHKTGAFFPFSFPERLIIAGRALWFYAGKMAFPHPLMAIYPRWIIGAGNPVQYLFPFSAVLLPFILFILRKRIGTAPLILIFYFGITIFPVLGFVDFGYMRFSFVADRFQYLAGIGVIVFVISSLKFLWDKMGRNGKYGSYGKYAGSGVILLLLGMMTWKQAKTYHDYETLFRHNVEKNPGSWAAHNNLATALEKKNDPDGAIIHYRKALELKSDECQIHYNLGSLFTRRNEIDKAIFHYEEALKIDPSYPEAHNNIGLLYDQKGDKEKALYHFRESLKYRQNHSATHVNLANSLSEMGDTRGAIRHFEIAIQINPSNTLAMNTLAWIYATHLRDEIRDAEKALKYGQRACEITQYGDAGCLDTLAAAYAEAGEFENAVVTAKRALAVKGSPELSNSIEKRLDLYQNGKPFRDESLNIDK